MLFSCCCFFSFFRLERVSLPCGWLCATCRCDVLRERTATAVTTHKHTLSLPLSLFLSLPPSQPRRSSGVSLLCCCPPFTPPLFFSSCDRKHASTQSEAPPPCRPFWQYNLESFGSSVLSFPSVLCFCFSFSVAFFVSLSFFLCFHLLRLVPVEREAEPFALSLLGRFSFSLFCLFVCLVAL